MVKYYKLISGKTIVGICSSLDFRTFQTKHKILLCCDETKGQYLRYGENLYRDNWMLPITTEDLIYELVEVIEISEKEYLVLKEATESGEEIIEEPDEQEEPTTYIEPEEEITIEYVKEKKIAEMSNICNRIIIDGFDVELSDEETYHFSLTTQDQLNFITLSTMIAGGETMIPYHADGELCKFYSAEDISKVIATATTFKTYHITYFNTLRNYIESMQSIDDVTAIEYGISIPEEYQSDVLKVLLSQMDGD